MNSVASSVTRQQPGGARGSGWVCISVPSLSRLAAIELLSTKNSLSLSETTQEALKLVSSGDSSSNVKALKIWVDTEGLDWLMTNKDTVEHRQTALSYCVSRQAHYPLLKKLFRITRNEATALRKQLNAPNPPVKPKNITESDLMGIYAYWRELGKDYELEIDRWVLLALRYPQYPLSCLYTAVWADSVEGGQYGR